MEGWKWPVILKPIDGSSSAGVLVIEQASQAPKLGGRAARFIAQEFWCGEEYTVNVFFDSSGVMRCAVPHLRREVRAGEVSKARTVRQPAMMDLAGRIGRKLHGPFGALCFQGIVRSDGEAIIFEINARFGGGYPLTHRAGAQFSRWLLEELAGLPVSANDQWVEGVRMLRYDAAVFVEA
jgi:carbamoyl-phosphate synthase large subunit